METSQVLYQQRQLCIEYRHKKSNYECIFLLTQNVQQDVDDVHNWTSYCLLLQYAAKCRRHKYKPNHICVLLIPNLVRTENLQTNGHE